MECYHCLLVQKKNPNRSARELSPNGSFEAVTMVGGTALCAVHAEIYTGENFEKKLNETNTNSIRDVRDLPTWLCVHISNNN